MVSILFLFTWNKQILKILYLGDDIICCGELEYYDKTYDRVNVKNEKPLQSVNRIFHTVNNI